MSIIEAARGRGGAPRGRVQAIHLKLGPLSGVVKEALLSAFEMACEGHTLAGARLVIEEVPIVVYCPHCQARQPISIHAVVLLSRLRYAGIGSRPGEGTGSGSSGDGIMAHEPRLVEVRRNVLKQQ